MQSDINHVKSSVCRRFVSHLDRFAVVGNAVERWSNPRCGRVFLRVTVAFVVFTIFPCVSSAGIRFSGDIAGEFGICQDNFIGQPFVTRLGIPLNTLGFSPGDTGHGEGIAVFTDRVYGSPGSLQWRLALPGPSSGAYDYHNIFYNPVSFQANLLGLDPTAAGLDIHNGSFPSMFNNILTAATPILPFQIPSGLTDGSLLLSFDITGFVRSRVLQSDSNGEFFDLGFAIRDLNSLVGQFAGFGNGFYLETRDGSAKEPFLPTVTSPSATPSGGTNHFVGSGRGHYDPLSASGFLFETTDGSLFTEAFDFPAGFDAPFTVTVDGTVVGHFNAGESADFSSFPGGGVTHFEVNGISPLVDAGNPLAFPLGLAFNHDTADFDMIAIPEPSTKLLMLVAVMGCFAAQFLRRTKILT